MGGHSHWAGIKHKKALVDSKRGKVWTKIVREITMAAKIGGGDVNGNPRLRKAVDDAKASNMPAENVKRAIQKGTGELPGAIYEELTFEGYGPGGVAIYGEGTTDNRNRTTNEVRKIYENHGGNMGSPGCVSFLFEKKGRIELKRAAIAEEELLTLVLDLGAEDLKTTEAAYEIVTSPATFEAVQAGLKAKKLALESAEVTLIAKTTVAVVEPAASKLLALVEALEDHDDVSKVYANFDIPDDVLAALEK